MQVVSNRDWHRISGAHKGGCILDDMDGPMVPATDEDRFAIVAAWNRRATRPMEGNGEGLMLCAEHGIYAKNGCAACDADLEALSQVGPSEFAAVSSTTLPCPECRAPGLLFECVACSHSNYPAKDAAPVADGFYLATFKHKDNGAVMWWGPDDAGYTPDLATAGITSGYHDNEYTVPVPVGFIKALRVRLVVDPGDSLNKAFWSAKHLRDALSALHQPAKGGAL